MDEIIKKLEDFARVAVLTSFLAGSINEFTLKNHYVRDLSRAGFAAMVPLVLAEEYRRHLKYR